MKYLCKSRLRIFLQNLFHSHFFRVLCRYRYLLTYLQARPEELNGTVGICPQLILTNANPISIRKAELRSSLYHVAQQLNKGQTQPVIDAQKIDSSPFTYVEYIPQGLFITYRQKSIHYFPSEKMISYLLILPQRPQEISNYVISNGFITSGSDL